MTTDAVPFRPDRAALEALYREYNRRDLAWPDPVSCIHCFDDVRDREIAGLVASSLAFGRVAQIHRSVEDALKRMGGAPSRFVRDAGEARLMSAFSGFRHRWVSGEDMAGLLQGVSRLVRESGSLESAFAAGMGRGDGTVMPACAAFCSALASGGGRGPGKLLPSGDGKCAFKRVNLMLRWMVRRDEIDPGGWQAVPASMLVVPLDTHMFRIGRSFGFTARRAADWRSALEITAGFAAMAPDDPVRYDFALTRMGMTGTAARADECGAQAQRD